MPLGAAINQSLQLEFVRVKEKPDKRVLVIHFSIRGNDRSLFLGRFLAVTGEKSGCHKKEDGRRTRRLLKDTSFHRHLTNYEKNIGIFKNWQIQA